MNGHWTNQAAKGIVLCAVLVTAGRRVVAADQPLLVELRDVCELSRKDAERSLSLRVQGTVTFVESEWNLMFVQTADHWAYVEIKTGMAPETGQLVEVTGYTWPGKSRTSIVATEVRVLGPGSLPEPVHVKPEADRRAIQHRWIEVNGIVTLAEAGEKWCSLHIASPEGVWFADVSTTPSLPPMAELKGRRVRLRGVLFSTESNPDDLRRLLVPEVGIVDLGTAGGDEEFGDARHISSLAWYDVVSGTRTKVRLVGQFRFRDLENRLVISDETGHCLVTPKDPTDGTPGDIVEVRGTVVHDQSEPYVVDADVLRIARDELPKATRMAAQEASRHMAKWVAVEGTLVSVEDSGRRPSLLMRGGDTVFRARLGEKFDQSLLDLRPGSLVFASGACWKASDPHTGFEIYTDATTVLAAAPSPLEPRSVLNWAPYAIVLALVVIVAMTVIVLWIVRKGARKQERYYELMNEQLSELSHVARLNMLSEMVGALAHELNQPLTSVANCAAVASRLSRDSADQAPSLGEVLAQIKADALRAGEIIRRLRNLVCKKTPGKVATDINQVVKDTMTLFRTQTVTAVGLVDLHLAEDLPTVDVDPIQIQQVILNLLLNAREATEHVRDRVAKITVSSRATDDGLTVIVEDNGNGISTSDSEAVFESFFTTKDEGIGLGLAICRKIVEMHDGKIAAERLKPLGTRMQFTLPAGKQSQARTD